MTVDNLKLLSERQAAFVAGILRGENGTQAAIAAGYATLSAKVSACTLRRNPKVAAAIAAGIKAREDEAKSSAEPAPDVLRLSPLEYMLKVMNDPSTDPVRRDRMALAAARFTHREIGDGGKKEERQDAAARVADSGKFKPAAPPKLIVNNRAR